MSENKNKNRLPIFLSLVLGFGFIGIFVLGGMSILGDVPEDENTIFSSARIVSRGIISGFNRADPDPSTFVPRGSQGSTFFGARVQNEYPVQYEDGVSCGALDLDGDNTVSEEEFNRMLTLYGQNCNDTKTYHLVGCGSLDVNLNGSIDYNDIETVLRRYMDGQSCEVDSQKIFCHPIDTNGNGRIDAEEIRNMNNLMNRECVNAPIRELCGGIDLNENGIIDQEDAVLATQRLRLRCSVDFSERVNCGHLDTNGDEKIDSADYKVFIDKFNKTCEGRSSSPSVAQCGAVDSNRDNRINLADFESSLKYRGLDFCNDNIRPLAVPRGF